MRVINRHRLGMAMGIGAGYRWDILDARDWPLRRCYICGRLDPPLDGDKFVCVVVRESVQSMCLHHSGLELSTVTDCLTGKLVEVPKSPPLVQKFVSDLFHENWYWLRVIVRYIWFTIREWLLYMTHPIRAVRLIRLCRKAGWDWW